MGIEPPFHQGEEFCADWTIAVAQRNGAVYKVDGIPVNV